MENEEAYISMRKSLDSLRDVALADYALIESDAGKKHFSDFVTEKVKAFLKENALLSRNVWDMVADDRAEALTNHAQELLAKQSSMCPPGFREENGLCVPI